MPDEPTQLDRRLKAIILADMKDFSTRMATNEKEAMDAIDVIRQVFDRAVTEMRGTFEVSGGDTVLALFDSAVHAVQAAVDVQTELLKRSAASKVTLPIRIGIHMGDVVRTQFEWMGHAIDVSARIQTLAPPGGVATSDDVYRAVKNRVVVPFTDTGPHHLKGIDEPMRVYAWIPGQAPVRQGEPPSPSPTPTHGGVPSPASRRVLMVAALSVLAVIVAGLASRLLPPLPPPSPPGLDKLVVGVMQIAARKGVESATCDFTRDALNTVLSKVDGLRVYSKQKIDFTREKRGLSEIEAAEELGIQKMISGTLAPAGTGLSLELQVIDIKSGMLDYSKETHGTEAELVEIQNLAAVELLKALHVAFDPERFRTVLSERMDETAETYRILTETMGGASGEPRSQPDPGWLDLVTPRSAWAGDQDKAAIEALLDRYRDALQSENVDRLVPLHVALTDRMREAYRTYFSNAEKLRVEFADLDIDVAGDEALATFTRRDDFTDVRTGSPVHFEVRVSTVVSKRDGTWRIQGLKQPS